MKYTPRAYTRHEFHLALCSDGNLWHLISGYVPFSLKKWDALHESKRNIKSSLYPYMILSRICWQQMFCGLFKPLLIIAFCSFTMTRFSCPLFTAVVSHAIILKFFHGSNLIQQVFFNHTT